MRKIKKGFIYKCTESFDDGVNNAKKNELYEVIGILEADELVKDMSYLLACEGKKIRLLEEEINQYFTIHTEKALSESLAISIVDLFENLLEEYGIVVPDADRTGAEEEAALYGMNYYGLCEDVAAVIAEYVE